MIYIYIVSGRSFRFLSAFLSSVQVNPLFMFIICRCIISWVLITRCRIHSVWPRISFVLRPLKCEQWPFWVHWLSVYDVLWIILDLCNVIRCQVILRDDNQMSWSSLSVYTSPPAYHLCIYFIVPRVCYVLIFVMAETRTWWRQLGRFTLL